MKREREIKAKEPVKIRFRELKGGNKSIFLESYTGNIVRNGKSVGGKHSYEFLKLYLIPEQNKADRQKNKETLALAKAIQSQRIIELQNGCYGFNRQARSKSCIFDYTENLYKEYAYKQSANYIRMIQNVMSKLKQFKGGDIRFSDINREFLNDFVEYLKQCSRYGNNGYDKGERLNPNTIYCYFAILKHIINRACRDGYLSVNPLKDFSISDKIKPVAQVRPYLTLEEIQELINAPCPYPLLKHAFLFSCMSGLRISDIRKMTWSNINFMQGKAMLNIKVQKTKDFLYLPLSNEALRWLPPHENVKPTDKVFPLKSDMTVNLNLLKWTLNAGINKHITFHVARHTHATMMLTLGADLYTVSKLLGHKNINTTQIYAKIIDKKKEEAINLIPAFR